MAREESLDAGTRQPHRQERHQLATLWFSLAAGPLAWVLGLNAGYSLVLVACKQGSTIWLHGVSIATLLLALGGLWAGLREWNRVTGDRNPEAEGRPLSLAQFMAALGMIGSAFFALVIVAQWAGSFILNPCMGI